MRGTKLRPLRPGASIQITPEAEHKQRVYCIYYQPCFDIVRKVYVHNNCRCNEIVALRNRVLFECVMPETWAVRSCRRIARDIADWLPPVPLGDGEWVQAYTGRKRRKYLQAEASLIVDPIRKSDAYIAAFIKAEKIFELKDPRLIQARTARYNYALGNYLKPIEHYLYNLKGTNRLKRWLPPGRLIAKGCNMERRARLIRSKMQRFHHPLVVSLDASRFDAHVTDLLEVEHLIYKRYWKDPYLDRLLAWQVNNRGRTSTGLRYRLKGSRMSGDMNTALGNCLISIMVLASVMKSLNLKPHKWDMLCDGDDVLLFIDRDYRSILNELPDLYRSHGFEIKVENVTENYNQVLFCQSHPIDTYHGPKMVSRPERVLSRALVGVKHWAEERFVPKYLYLIGYCELAVSMGAPILQEFATTILSWGSRLPKNVTISGRVVKALREERLHDIEPVPITAESRLSFWAATGIPPEEQRAYEGALRAMNRHASKGCETTDLPPAWWRGRSGSWPWSSGTGSSPSSRPLKTAIDREQLRQAETFDH